MASYFINGTTGNDSNNGLTSGTAWKTLNKAYGTAAPTDTLTVTNLNGTGPALVDITGGVHTSGILDFTGTYHNSGIFSTMIQILPFGYMAAGLLSNVSSVAAADGMMDSSGVYYAAPGALNSSGVFGGPGVILTLAGVIEPSGIIDFSGSTFYPHGILDNNGVEYPSGFLDAAGNYSPYPGADNNLCNRADIENIFGIPNVAKWALLSANAPDSPAGLTEITTRIAWAITLSSVDFRNAMRQGGYKLPLDGPDGTVWQTNIVAIRAGLYLYMHLRPTQRGEDGRPLPDKFDGLFTYCEQQLDFVRSRKLKLDGTVYGSGSNAPLVTHSPNRNAVAPGPLFGPPQLPDRPWIG
jgi:hypothetical protein